MSETPTRPDEPPANQWRGLPLEAYDRLRTLMYAWRDAWYGEKRAEVHLTIYVSEPERSQARDAWDVACARQRAAESAILAYAFDLLGEQAIYELAARGQRRREEEARKADGPRADAPVQELDPATYYTTPMAAAEPSGSWSGATKPAGLGQK